MTRACGSFLVHELRDDGAIWSHVPAMGLISGFTLIRVISLFHITAAFFFLTAPKKIVDQNVVFILGESIRVVGTPMATYAVASIVANNPI